MKTINRTVILAGIVIVMVSFSAFSVPPYLWYATYSVENYAGNGCSSDLNTHFSHEEADGFSRAINSIVLTSSIQYRYNRRDAYCTANCWIGPNAEVNFVDFVFYSGHGCGTGPYFGCTSNYLITNWSDIRFGGSGYLKWVQAAACKWFVPDSLDYCQSGMNEFQRWENCFQGVHTVQGHRAVTYEYLYYDSMSTDFWNRWVNQNNTIHAAWKNSQIHWVYEMTGYSGLQPVTAAPNYSYATELWQNANDNPAPSEMNYIIWTTVGTPQY